MNRRVLLDASFWIAYRDERQTKHKEALRIFSEILHNRIALVVTLPIVCEIQARFCRNPARSRLILADFSNNPLVQMEEVTHQDQQRAFRLLELCADKSYSLCDTISFTVMRRLGLKQALAFDDHFRQFGEFQIIS